MSLSFVILQCSSSKEHSVLCSSRSSFEGCPCPSRVRCTIIRCPSWPPVCLLCSSYRSCLFRLWSWSQGLGCPNLGTFCSFLWPRFPKPFVCLCPTRNRSYNLRKPSSWLPIGFRLCCCSSSSQGCPCSWIRSRSPSLIKHPSCHCRQQCSKFSFTIIFFLQDCKPNINTNACKYISACAWVWQLWRMLVCE